MSAAAAATVEAPTLPPRRGRGVSDGGGAAATAGRAACPPPPPRRGGGVSDGGAGAAGRSGAASKMCPFAEQYDADLHEFLSNLRRVDGSIPVHPQYGLPVNIFAPKDSRKYWVRASTPVLG